MPIRIRQVTTFLRRQFILDDTNDPQIPSRSRMGPACSTDNFCLCASALQTRQEAQSGSTDRSALLQANSAMSEHRMGAVRLFERSDLVRSQFEIHGCDCVIEVMRLARSDDRRGHSGTAE